MSNLSQVLFPLLLDDIESEQVSELLRALEDKDRFNTPTRYQLSR